MRSWRPKSAMYVITASAPVIAVFSLQTYRKTCFVNWFTITCMWQFPCLSGGVMLKPSMPRVDLALETLRCRVTGAMRSLVRVFRYF